jgi:hypothetical protein
MISILHCICVIMGYTRKFSKGDILFAQRNKIFRYQKLDSNKFISMMHLEVRRQSPRCTCPKK